MASTPTISERTTSQALPRERAMILFVTTLGGFLVTFITSAINVALPEIGREFDLSPVLITWLSLSTILVSAAVLLPFGRLADLHGRVRFFILGMVVFAIASFGSALAPSAGVLLAMRMLSGLSLAIGSVSATALVISAYPPGARGKALGLSVGCFYLGLTLGPALGGLIIQYLGWRYLFVIVGTGAVINSVLPFWKLRHLEWREPKQGRFDVAGSVTYGIGLTVLLLGFSFLPGPAGVVLLVAGIAGLAGFLWREGRADDPLLPMDLLKENRVFTFSNSAVFVNYAATAALSVLMALYLQSYRGLSPGVAGLVLFGGSLVQALFSPLAGRLADRTVARYVASAGMALCALALFGLIFLGPTTPYWYIILFLSVLGLGMAFFSTPATLTITESVDPSRMGTATATIAAMRQTGQNVSLGLATLLLALYVGHAAMTVEDYPKLLTPIRLSFLIFTVLSVVGVGACLVGPVRIKAAAEPAEDHGR